MFWMICCLPTYNSCFKGATSENMVSMPFCKCTSLVYLAMVLPIMVSHSDLSRIASILDFQLLLFIISRRASPIVIAAISDRVSYLLFVAMFAITFNLYIYLNLFKTFRNMQVVLDGYFVQAYDFFALQANKMCMAIGIVSCSLGRISIFGSAVRINNFMQDAQLFESM